LIEQKFEHIGLDKGLSQSVVYDILQDKRGFMWFATQDGLNRYDGYKFKVYKADYKSGSLKSNYVRKIFQDKKGELWFGTLGDGVFRYDRDMDVIMELHYDGSENIVMGICEDENGFIWTGSTEGGFKIFDSKDSMIENSSFSFNTKEINSNQITCIHCKSGGDILIGTWDKGLYLYNAPTNEIRNYRHDAADNSSLSNDRVLCIFEDQAKDIWIGTRNGLNRFDVRQKKFERIYNIPGDVYSLSENFVTCIAEDKDNFLWLGTKNCGLNKFDKSTGKFLNFRNNKNNFHSLSNDTISSLYCDESNVLWAGTFGGCISKLDCGNKKFYSLRKNHTGPDDKSWSNILSVHKDKNGAIWIGTYNQGLFKVDSEGKILERYIEDKSIENNIVGLSITCITEDDNCNLWVGAMRGGLNKFDISKREFKFFPISTGDGKYRILSLCMSSDRKFLWIGTSEDGLLKFDLLNECFVRSNTVLERMKVLEHSKINALYSDSQGVLWIGTSGRGLIYFDEKTDEFRFITDAGAEHETELINVICEDSASNILAGTLNGILRYERISGNLKKHSGDGIFELDIVKGILPDEKGNLWISSGKGLFRFNPDTETYRNYQTSDGLQSEEFVTGAYFKDNDDCFYFGGTNGINFFKPSEIIDNEVIPNIVITEFQIFNIPVRNSSDNPYLRKSITEAGQVNLSYRESVFSFEFASLSYNNPNANLYAYKMEGFDKEWINCDARRFATYTNLEPGDYVFRVKGSNNDGFWNEDGASIKISISPPFWKTWWFKSLGAVFIAGVTGAAYKNKLSKIEKEKKAQEEFSRKLIASQETERKRIATELHDTIAHDILITKNKAVIGLRDTASPESVSKILNEISDLASNTLNDVRSISYNLHPHQIERLGLSKAIKSIANRISKSTDIKFSVSVDDIDGTLSTELEINIFRIIQECFNNILKHSQATEAVMNVSRQNDKIAVLIADNGIGFSNEKKDGLGLKGISERLKLYNGNLKIESDNVRGTRIEIYLPCKGDFRNET